MYREKLVLALEQADIVSPFNLTGTAVPSPMRTEVIERYCSRTVGSRLFQELHQRFRNRFS
jgi:hypothetical protein